MTKEVEGIFKSSAFHMVGDGFRVANYFPNGNKFGRKISPFILLDYHPPFYYSPTKNKRGVGVHPHRGFETVTLALDGYVAHHDSGGNSGIIGPGDVQWMTAASGVLHKEFHEKEWSKKGGEFQMVQLWVNLPAKHKMSAPKYQAIENKTIPRFLFPNNEGEIEIIAGEYNGIKGSAFTFTPLHLFNAKLNKHSTASFTFPKNYNTALLVIEGEILVNETEKAVSDQFVLMANDGEEFKIKANNDAIVLILSGEPINEPIAAHGPFVMNTKQELIQAFEDFNTGKFGHLED